MSDEIRDDKPEDEVEGHAHLGVQGYSANDEKSDEADSDDEVEAHASRPLTNRPLTN